MSQFLAHNIIASTSLATCRRSFAPRSSRKLRRASCSAEKIKPAELITLNANPYDSHVSYAHAGFPPGFLFGAGSSAYQVEGATREGGRGPSIWDTFCAEFPEKIADRSNGDPGAGSYYNYERDVQLLKELGVNVYRFSISWSRILPTGRGEPNEEGIRYYKNLIRELKQNGIKPFVTIFHWDVPHALEHEYGGFLSDKIVEDYKYFADVCFKNFGDEVKHWVSLNEPLTFSNGGYSLGVFAPGRCTPGGFTIDGHKYLCHVGNSITEPYIVSHNLLRAHAEVVKHYRDNYKAKQRGKIGITLVSSWFVPYTDSPLNIEAQKRALEFNLGWFMDPLKFGDYPFSMKSLVRDRLPQFSKEESEKLKNSYDFIGLNYYTSQYAKNKGFQLDYQPIVYSDDARVDTPVSKNGVPIGYAEDGSWLHVYPRGLKELLLYMKERYNNPEIYITENGVSQVKITETPIAINEEMDDTFREQYQSIHLHELVEAMRQGVKLKGYFVWSFQDSFELKSGYTSKYGLTYVNNGPNVHYADLVKKPKDSFRWYKWFISIAKVQKYFDNEEDEEEEEEKEKKVKEEEEVEAEISLSPTRL